MAFDTKPNRAAKQFQFINTTEEGRFSDADSPKVVRAHAMRDFRRRQRLQLRGRCDSGNLVSKPKFKSDTGKTLSVRLHRMEQVPMSELATGPIPGSLLGCISPISEVSASETRLEDQLLDIEEPEDEQNYCIRPCSGGFGASASSFPYHGNAKGKQSETQRGCSITGSKALAIFVDTTNSGLVILHDERESRSNPALVESVPAIGKMDPFDIIPAPNTERVRALIHHWNEIFVTSNFPVTPKQTWFNDALRDPLAFHGSLLCVSSNLALLKRSNDMSECTSLHIKTVRMINERLADPVQCIGNATLAAVASVALYEAAACKPSGVHMNGMQKMVELRGGLAALRKFARLHRLITWAEMITAKLTNSKPRPSLTDLSYAQRPLLGYSWQTNTTSLAEDLRDPMASLSLIGLQRKLVKALQELRQLSYLASSVQPTNIQKMDGVHFADRVYAVEHQLLVLSLADEQLGTPLEDFITRACSMAGHTYIYLAVRQLMLNAPLFDTFTSQLKSSLDQPCYLLMWSKSHPVMLLWVVVVGGCAAIERPEWAWFVNQLLKVVLILKIATLDDLRRLLEQAAWFEYPFKESLTVLWSETEYQLRIFSDP